MTILPAPRISRRHRECRYTPMCAGCTLRTLRAMTELEAVLGISEEEAVATHTAAKAERAERQAPQSPAERRTPGK